METNKPNLVTGKLYLIPTTLGDNAPLEVLPYSVKRAVESLEYYIAENERSARRFIKKLVPNKNQGDLVFQQLNKFTEPQEILSFLDPCIQGIPMGLLSEAGCPAIADPGAEVVALAHQKKIQVVPLVGPSSILMALMASGFNGQNFAFNGYLPIESTLRRKAIKSYEAHSRDTGQAQIFIETPYRNEKLFEEFKKNMNAKTRLCVAVDLTQANEMIFSKTVGEWKSYQLELHKRPAIFIIQG